MKAVRWTSERKPGLKLHDEAAPKPGPHEVVVRVHAASLNFRDQAILDDAYGGPTKPNGVPLSDGAGEVVAVGAEVTRTKVGDRVSASCCQHWIGGPNRPEYHADSLGMTTDGWLAENILLHENAIVLLPNYISYAEAASLPCAAVTAWTGLNQSSPLQAGETVLVQPASPRSASYRNVRFSNAQQSPLMARSRLWVTRSARRPLLAHLRHHK